MIFEIFATRHRSNVEATHRATETESKTRARSSTRSKSFASRGSRIVDGSIHRASPRRRLRVVVIGVRETHSRNRRFHRLHDARSVARARRASHNRA